jgi:hypothetical protein
LLHDGRASTPRAAIVAHDGQGAASRDAFALLPPARQEQQFLDSLQKPRGTDPVPRVLCMLRSSRCARTWHHAGHAGTGNAQNGKEFSKSSPSSARISYRSPRLLYWKRSSRFNE